MCFGIFGQHFDQIGEFECELDYDEVEYMATIHIDEPTAENPELEIDWGHQSVDIELFISYCPTCDEESDRAFVVDTLLCNTCNDRIRYKECDHCCGYIRASGVCDECGM